MLLCSDGGGCRAGLRNGVDHFARARITELLARFFLNGVGVVLQRIHVMRKTRIFFFELDDFFVEGPMFRQLVRINHRPVCTENHVVGDPNGNQAQGQRGGSPAPLKDRLRDAFNNRLNFFRCWLDSQIRNCLSYSDREEVNNLSARFQVVFLVNFSSMRASSETSATLVRWNQVRHSFFAIVVLIAPTLQQTSHG